MTYEELAKVNKQIKTTDIKGKAYAEVNERINAFRKLFPNGTISTEIISLEDGVCIIKATALNENGVILGTGHAYEKENSTFINKTSYIENAETSAVGRCLGMIGIGVETSVASYEEVANAVVQQEEKPKAKENKPAPKKSLSDEDKIARTMLLELCKQYELKPAEVAFKYKLTNNSPAEDFYKAIEKIKGVKEETKDIEEYLEGMESSEGNNG